jgi:N-acetylglucosaminyldiphosphoundecaprenol N-acetyl-beta-D-mannosaminyltransferase
MNQPTVNGTAAKRPAIAILGVPFDNITTSEALATIENMIVSREPHYVVTANVDFVVQARNDVELLRIFFDAHLVLCDGTPLVWASRMLGNALPERVAGADIVPLLIQMADKKGYRVFLLGATPASSSLAIARLKAKYPNLETAHYSPPFNKLLEMDHEEIKKRILAAKPDILLISFGCPKQEKWMTMHYRSLGVPVSIGVGATIDFLAGQVRRAPLWMQRSGTEWIFRLAQEPRRLLRRYLNDLWIFGFGIIFQYLRLRMMPPGREVSRDGAVPVDRATEAKPAFQLITPPERLDYHAVRRGVIPADSLLIAGSNYVLDMRGVQFIDSTGIGALIRLKKKLHEAGHQLVLLSPTSFVRGALNLMHLKDFFGIATSLTEAELLLAKRKQEALTSVSTSSHASGTFVWRGEITAANIEEVWHETKQSLDQAEPGQALFLDLSDVRFIDSSGLGLMLRARKHALVRNITLQVIGMQPAVRNVLRLARLEGLFAPVQASRRSPRQRSLKQPEPLGKPEEASKVMTADVAKV